MSATQPRAMFTKSEPAANAAKAPTSSSKEAKMGLKESLVLASALLVCLPATPAPAAIADASYTFAVNPDIQRGSQLALVIAPLGQAKHDGDAVELVGGHGGRWNQGGGGWHAGMHGGGGGGRRGMMGHGFNNMQGRGGGGGWHAGMHGAGGGGAGHR
ncbi:hypothetical protein [Bradyrhizobium sp. CCBAU 21359]|uniref:hypothetical protein n=1 Tax=Bradyrhizobium sp. CCBAU 21359 TaxID=1325080 RepID=UPI002305FA75|nr:hypothetical protein [Bradyrhizobium sp. CCBAU 21359]